MDGSSQVRPDFVRPSLVAGGPGRDYNPRLLHADIRGPTQPVGRQSPYGEMSRGRGFLMQGSQAIAEILKREGVEHVFCFPFTPILDALAEAGIRPIVARQERVAENMADGFSRATLGKRIGVVTVQQNAGAENAFSGIAQALHRFEPDLVSSRTSGTRTRPHAADLRRGAELRRHDQVGRPDPLGRARSPIACGGLSRCCGPADRGPCCWKFPSTSPAKRCPSHSDYRPVCRSASAPIRSPFATRPGCLLKARAAHDLGGAGGALRQASRELTAVAEYLRLPS